MNLPLNPKAVAAAALASGSLRVVGEYVVSESKLFPPFLVSALKTPEEAGIAPIRPAPKPDSPKILRHAKRKANYPRYVITKKQRPDLFP